MLAISERLQAVEDRVDHQRLIATGLGIAPHPDLRQADAFGLEQQITHLGHRGVDRAEQR